MAEAKTALVTKTVTAKVEVVNLEHYQSLPRAPAFSRL